ncbi:hypothetical protein BCR39DRAFT_48448 [Naematelia encephala]|uniref:Uncharacterized protein n=1 Tax=Naematelia encephala TaxID=71784 RepID=A0A1Y2AHB1_9TREE|nr:hypothetical protein BCR39DRAFT_48448 [Naematelia encephala]
MLNLDPNPAPLPPPYQYQSEGTGGRKGVSGGWVEVDSGCNGDRSTLYHEVEQVGNGNVMEGNDEDDDKRNIGLHDSEVGDERPDVQAILREEDPSKPLQESQPLVPVSSNTGSGPNDVEGSPPPASIITPIIVSGGESTTTPASTLISTITLPNSIQNNEAPVSAAVMEIRGESTATPLNTPPLALSAGDLQSIAALSSVDRPGSTVTGVMPGIPLAMSPSGQSIEDDATKLVTSHTEPGLSLVEAAMSPPNTLARPLSTSTPTSTPTPAPALPPQLPPPPSSSSTVFPQKEPLTISLWGDFARKCEDPVFSSWVQDAVRRRYGNQPFTSRPLYVPVSTDRTIKIDFATGKYYLPEFSLGSDVLAAELLIDAIMGLFDTDECEDWERVGNGDPFWGEA